MKKYLLQHTARFLTVVVFLAAFLLIAQFARGWVKPGGNPPSVPGSFIPFDAGGGRRFLGINQQAPQEQLHLSDGSLRVDGGIEAVSARIPVLRATSLTVDNAADFEQLSVRGGLTVGDSGHTAHAQFIGTTTVSGNLDVAGGFSKGGLYFLIDHPLDPERKSLRHAAVESPEMKNVYDGIAVLDARGETPIELPTYFEALNRDYRYQFMPLGAPAPGLYIKEKIKNNRFVIGGGSPGVRVSWQVTGVRKDPWAEAHPLAVEEEKEAPGYLYPELFAK